MKKKIAIRKGEEEKKLLLFLFTEIHFSGFKSILVAVLSFQSKLAPDQIKHTSHRAMGMKKKGGKGNFFV